MIEIIPAIDIIDGKCVRLIQGDYNRKTVYDSNPMDVAKSFEDIGVKRLHIVDLDGARIKHIVNYKVLESVAANTSLKIDFGGGIRSDQDMDIVFNSGAAMATIGSIAITDKKLFLSWLDKFGCEKIILSADVRNEMIAISGWGENTSTSIYDMLREYIDDGIKYVLCSDINKDGTFMGTSTELYKKIIERFPSIKLIASGGFADISEIDAASQIGAYGIIIGKAIYDGKVTLSQIKAFISKIVD